MKKLTAVLAFSLLSVPAFAGHISYSTAEFAITKVSPMCPAPRPGEVTCMSTAGKVTVMATVGCLDKVVFSQFEVEGNELHAVSVVRVDSDSLKVLCYRANTFVKEVSVPDVHNIHIINEEIR